MRVIAEWGQTFRGSVEMACRQASIAARAGCWASKWQMLTPGALAAADAPAYWEHAALGEQQRDTFTHNKPLAYDAWAPIVEHCAAEGIVFLSSAFDLRAVEALYELKVPAVKIASGDITYRTLLEHVGATDMAVFLSTGAANGAEIERALGWLGADTRVTLMACDLVYPCWDEAANLARITWLVDKFVDAHDERIDVGYSDHTIGTSAALAGGALDAAALEKHVTLNPMGGTPDDEMGLPWEDLAEYVAMAHLGVELRGEYGPGPSPREAPALVGARRSWHATVDLERGDRIDGGRVAALRPCFPDALPVSDDPVGWVLTAPVKAGRPIPLAAVERA